MLYVFAMVLVVCAVVFWRGGARSLPVPVPEVVIDERGIRRHIRGTDESVAWDDLVRIEIMTTDEGPFAEDVFWLFVAHDGTGCALPGGAVQEALWERLKQLPDVDFEAVVRAMGSTESASFQVWRGVRGAASAAPVPA